MFVVKVVGQQELLHHGAVVVWIRQFLIQILQS